MMDGYVLGQNGDTLEIGNSKFSYAINGVQRFEDSFENGKGLSEEYLCVKTTENGVQNKYYVWKDVPVIEMPMREGGFQYQIKGNNYVLRTVVLSACTDYHDTFVVESTYYMYRRKLPKREGNIFFLDDPLEKTTYIFISLSPDYVKAKIWAEGGFIFVENDCHGIVFGKCATGEESKICRQWYRNKCIPQRLFTMVNNWGDYKAFDSVSEDLIKLELDDACKIGLDVFQIDDGWQIGNTADNTIRDERGRRVFREGFWEPNSQKFKNGIGETSSYAGERGVIPGLWFAPDSYNCYGRFERDITVLKKAYNEWGIRCFKLDMLNMDDMPMFKKFEKMLETVYSLGNDVSVQLDVTNGVRGGYLSLTQYGRLFAENRYTHLETYYPHRTMRNLWNVCKYIPAYKFQFELLNPTLKADKYSPDDLLAPCNYDMDYLFAAVMMSNPLFWMEVRYLPQKQRDELNRILPVWRKIRVELAYADVIPIGQCPDGASFSGFCAYSADGKKAYLSVFREVNCDDNYTFEICREIKNAKVLASNSEICYDISCGQGKINVRFEKMRSYALIEIELE